MMCGREYLSENNASTSHRHSKGSFVESARKVHTSHRSFERKCKRFSDVMQQFSASYS